MTIDELLASFMDDWESYTDEYKRECHHEIKGWFLDRIDNSKSIKELRGHIASL